MYLGNGSVGNEQDTFIMRRRVIEVNVDEKGIVPPQPWLARAYLWACERLYAEMAWTYDVVSWLVSGGQWRRWQASVWREVIGKDVLELGSGTGVLLAQGAARGHTVVGVDRSPEMLAVAQRRLTKASLLSAMVQGDGRALPLQDQVFDTVMATFPAGYILDVATLAEIRRVVRDGGRLVIVGLWVEVHVGALSRWMPIFYGRPSATRLEKIEERVASVGFGVRWAEQREGRFTVGNLIADREP